MQGAERWKSSKTRSVGSGIQSGEAWGPVLGLTLRSAVGATGCQARNERASRRANQLQRDVRPAVALNSRCYERLRTPRCGLVMVVVLVGASSWLRPGRVKRPSLSLALSPTEDCGAPSVVDRRPRRSGSWGRTRPTRTLLEGEAGPASGLNSDPAGITATRPEGGPRWGGVQGA